MAHEDAGHYAAKHPGGKIDAAIADEIRNRENGGCVTCAAAHEIAKKQGVSPKIVGMNIDLLEKRINKCQMGLFGYGANKDKKIEVSSAVAQDLKKAITDAMDGGKISCDAAWAVANRLNLTKLEVACACESMEIKVSTCQLGAF